ncbi:hypothetical protein ACTHO0_00575 [Cytobacillus praedii]|uniref:Uncharacterized protein n=1 Tax=Cytobacillus praedii TaxID=1742358 RepID=A0A4R1B3Y3_9BACI|nr:hypothetical protein [Cytobacillus praedii]MED3551419.1 hypothetical protein [Cytobacillus praedii]MED3572519.1 hypothetical protein [Cytobacillus praedii]TCJ04951.1 hypothetical protein E0Y62_06950 [Cytobacillus praedii]
MGIIKRIFLLIAGLGQILAIILLFINLKAAVIFYLINILLIVGVVIVLLIERIKEKEEDDRNDYRNY